MRYSSSGRSESRRSFSLSTADLAMAISPVMSDISVLRSSSSLPLRAIPVNRADSMAEALSGLSVTVAFLTI